MIHHRIEKLHAKRDDQRREEKETENNNNNKKKRRQATTARKREEMTLTKELSPEKKDEGILEAQEAHETLVLYVCLDAMNV